MILAGYEIGTGERVNIPATHMAVTGQTQRSGKTTAMEAIVERSGMRAIAFITKRGESAFQFGHTIAPYFKERADWMFVKELFEQLTGYAQNDKEEEIIHLCDGAKSLEQVWGRVQSGLDPKKKTALSRRRSGLYVRMNAYFQELMPTLTRIPKSNILELRKGVNVIDMREFEGQHSVQEMLIRNALHWVYEKEEKTIFIVPEAWDFLSEEHGSITRTAGREFIRRSAAMHNSLWADCQDIRGLDKTILGQMGVWLVGIQTEMNEVARTIKSFPSLPAPPSITELMSLGVGEFYVLHGSVSKKTFVQAVWADAHACALYAKDRSADGKPRRLLPKMPPPPPGSKRRTELHLGVEFSPGPLIGPEEAEKATAAQVMRQLQEGDCDEQDRKASEPTGHIERRSRSAGLQSGGDNSFAPDVSSAGDAVGARRTIEPHSQSMVRPGTDSNSADHFGNEAQPIEITVSQLRTAVRQIETKVDSLAQTVDTWLRATGSLSLTEKGREIMAKKDESASASQRAGLPNPWADREDEREEQYQWFRARAMRDPELLSILVTKPELRIKVERPVLEVNGDTLRGALGILITKGFFKQPVKANAAYEELKRLGRRVAKPGVYRECDKLAELGFLTSEADGYQAVEGMKIRTVEA